MNTTLGGKARPLVGLTLGLSLAAPAAAGVVEGQIETNIRPIVWLRYSGTTGGTPETRTAVGIFDTGDPCDTLSRETAALFGLTPSTPLHPQLVWARTRNEGTVAAQTITSAGWFGGTFNQPERTSVAWPAGVDPAVRAGDPAHTFQTADPARTTAMSCAGLHPTYFDYNFGFSENHTGDAFVTRADPEANLSVFIDPINATPIAFAYDGVTGGNGRGLSGPSLELDRRASSVSYFANDDSRVPVPGRNDNPGFVHFVDLTPVEFSSTTLTPAPGNAVVNAALPVDRRLTITVADAVGPDVARIVPWNFAGLEPGYRPANADGSTVLAYTNAAMEVREAGMNIGGQENPSGFVRSDGTVQVIVRQVDGTVRLNQTVQLPSQAPRTYGQINIPGLIADTGYQLIDTGAPTTRRGGPDAITGTDELNKCGQFFDFSPVGGGGAGANHGRLTLIAPSDPRIRTMRGNGILMGVDAGTVGLSRTAVNQESQYGSIPQLQVGANTLVTPAVPGEAGGTIFRTHLTGSNASYIDEDATALIRGADVIDAQSLGGDGITPQSPLFFSVGRNSVGQPGSAVNGQSMLNQVPGDIFEIPGDQPPYQRVQRFAGRTNSLTINQEVMGLGPNVGPLAAAVPSPDNLNSFDLYTQAALPPVSLSNLDSPIMAHNDGGTADRPRVGADRLAVNFDLYFSLEDGEDIYRSSLAQVFADGFDDIGLAEEGDDIDALAFFRPSVAPGIIGESLLDFGPAISTSLIFNGAHGDDTYDPNLEALFLGIDAFHGGPPTDLALFSLAPDSASLLALGLSAADIFITDFDGTFAMYATAESLGLLFGDDVDGLDAIVPEPTTLALLALGIVFLRRRR